MKFPKIGITHGDINGIGYEVLLKVLQDPELLDFCTPVIFGSASIFNATLSHIGLEPVSLHVIPSANEATEGHVNLVEVCGESQPTLEFGQQTEAALQAEAQSLTAAVTAYSKQEIDALVTLPGHLDNDDTSHSLTQFIRKALGGQSEVFDWIMKQEFRTLLLHPIDVSTELGEGLASEALHIHLTLIYHNLRQDFGMIRPRIAVISRHNKITNDLQDLREEGITVFGPFDPTEFVTSQSHRHYDASLFLDEIPARDQLLGQEDADYSIGFVTGLPLVLTYPMQSINYAAAGQGTTSEIPLRQSIYAAIDMLHSRISYQRATHHPLEKQWIPRGRDDFKLDLTGE